MSELEKRRRKIAQIRTAQLADPADQAGWAVVGQQREERAQEARLLLEELGKSEDVESFRTSLDHWSKQPGYAGFAGFGMMFIHQLANRAPDAGNVARLLHRSLSVPSDEEAARGQLKELLQFVEDIKKGGQPAPRRAPFVISLFWSMQSGDDWPCLWSSAAEMLQILGWLPRPADLTDWYLDYRHLQQESGLSPDDFERAMWWLKHNPFVGLDPSLIDRCHEGADIIRRLDAGDKTYPSTADEQLAEVNARGINGDLQLLGLALSERVGGLIGQPVTVTPPQIRTGFSKGDPFRAEGWLILAIEGGFNAPSFRVWATESGVSVGLYAGWPSIPEEGERWQERRGRELSGALPAGTEFFRIRPVRSGSRLEAVGAEYPGGDLYVGRWFEGATAIDRVDFIQDVTNTLTSLIPTFMKLLPGESPIPGPDVNDELSSLVDEFRASQGYPSPRDEWNISERASMAQSLSPDALDEFDVDVFRKMAVGNRYGHPGPQSHLNTTLTNLQPEDIDRFSETIRILLWDEGEFGARIDRALDHQDLGFSGLGEAVIVKLLAITHPDRFLPVFPYRGPSGKRALMQLIGLPPPHEANVGHGELHVTSNDAIRGKLEPHFPGDPWGQMRFLYWLRARGEAPERQVDLDALGQLSTKLLLDRAFLEEIVELLHDKGQVIFYGPPGTGKTFVAKALAHAITLDASRWKVVQFHPSTSYEDFFEGFRPDLEVGDILRYQLVQGPLALIAERAADAPGVDHVLVIDEINRANLPRVFGELLFLLEYRREAITTLYRPDDAFELPNNLLFIGTMNTADRSIALVDAALRRRFHFIPFFPHEGPLAGLLQRWLEKNGEPGWVAELVDMVNEELRDRLGGPHLQIGPSHFMVKDLDLAKLERIWTYNVFPYVEEQLYGEWEEINAYRWGAVRARFLRESGAEMMDREVLGEDADEVDAESESEVGSTD